MHSGSGRVPRLPIPGEDPVVSFAIPRTKNAPFLGPFILFPFQEGERRAYSSPNTSSHHTLYPVSAPVNFTIIIIRFPGATITSLYSRIFLPPPYSRQERAARPPRLSQNNTRLQRSPSPSPTYPSPSEREEIEPPTRVLCRIPMSPITRNKEENKHHLSPPGEPFPTSPLSIPRSSFPSPSSPYQEASGRASSSSNSAKVPHSFQPDQNNTPCQLLPS